MNVFRTFIVPASKGPLAVRITDALGYPERGMFTTQVDDAGSVVGYISTGILDDASPILRDAATLHDAVIFASPLTDITYQDCADFVAALDNTDAEPFARMDFVREEIALGATAVPWVQPTGAQDAYALDAVVSYGGQAWRNITPANVWQPGVSGWRLLWATTTAAPAWVQPTGAHDAYNIGDRVSFNGKNYESLIAANVWSPSVYPAGWKAI